MKHCSNKACPIPPSQITSSTRCGLPSLRGMAVHRVLGIQHRDLLRKILTLVMEQHRDRATHPFRKRRKTLRDSTPPRPLKVRKSYNVYTFVKHKKNQVFLTDETFLQTNNKTSSTLPILPRNIHSPLPRPLSKGPVRRHRFIWQVRRFQLRSKTIRHETRPKGFRVLESHRLNLSSEWPH